ncbi:hypothetical protein SS50377_26297 [Spironucleus salmonicida]|uniref:Uncharacterized protein n=1 Tax=Spironucleus salmonicida TaxID=348837 RepID=V6LA92_9EUKA|nr:hypothetical protein SS50377_26279 [Spironucleus salmonicida]KAH0572075.1 hypothetical protein SS50377_26282 [Spironucleus salmonicida]KAH0572081.1 hypothetical protein SS50377_26288 [Spironucleus salmonicida]KAH0572084.1 hypothetical protein SS50377_26291 [Spironucleus salmonicida]KAH0572090.1 hypothetical protein SS50377_26297 [Spironucleus salmonicida]|eukprot:EST41292.1 Hypothetical protein SS50377_19243 [Spironucleus salmonicida]
MEHVNAKIYKASQIENLNQVFLSQQSQKSAVAAEHSQRGIVQAHPPVYAHIDRPQILDVLDSAQARKAAKLLE